MLKEFLLITFVLVTHIVCAQQSRVVKKVDELIDLGHSIKTKNIDSVLLLANTALIQSREAKYELGIVKAMTLASFYYFDNYKYDTAKFLLNQSLHFFARFSKHQNSLDHGQIFLHLGYIAVKEFEYQLALKYANNALDIFRKINNTKYILSTLTLLGDIESNQGNYAKALAYHSNALRLKTENRYPKKEFTTDLTNIAIIYLKIGQYEKAIQYSKKAISISTDRNSLLNQIKNLNNIGECYSALNEFDSAIHYFERCSILATKQNDSEKRDLAILNMASIFNKIGQYQKSNYLAKKINTKGAAIDIRQNAEILLATNYLYQGQLDSSISGALKLYRLLYSNSKNKESSIKLSHILAQAYESKKRYDSAFYYLTIYQSLSDSVYNIENQRKLGLLYAELESLEKEREIEILQKDRILRKKQSHSYLIILTSSTIIIVLACTSILLFFRNKSRNSKIVSNELNRQLERKKRDLHHQTLKIIYMNNGLIEIESSLKRLQNQIDKHQVKDIDLLLETIQNSKTLEVEWQNFTLYFDQVYDQFTEKLSNRFPNLSTAEKRLILLIKMELKNREIASILNIDTASVKMAKYRLKKKMQLPEEIDVQLYLSNFN